LIEHFIHICFPLSCHLNCYHLCKVTADARLLQRYNVKAHALNTMEYLFTVNTYIQSISLYKHAHIFTYTNHSNKQPWSLFHINTRN